MTKNRSHVFAVPSRTLAVSVFIAAMWAQVALTQQAKSADTSSSLDLTYDALAKVLDESGFFDPSSERRSVTGNRESWHFSKTRSRGNSELFHVFALGPTSLGPDAIYLWFAPVNGSGEDNERATSLIGTIAQQVFPQWTEVGEWIKAASVDAWHLSARTMEGRVPAGQDVIVSIERSGAWIDVIGVPPDLFIYMITPRQECRLGETFMLRRANPCFPESKKP